MNVVIIGMRGVGKSNVSRRVGLATKRPIMSTDVLVEYESGLNIPQFVEQRGWREFRDVEHQVLGKLVALDNSIIDCGGGIVVDLDDDGREIRSERKVALLREIGPIVWLSGDLHRLAVKAAGGGNRPVLDETRSALELMRRRLPFYQDAADFTIDVEGRRRQDIAEAIARLVYGEVVDPSIGL